jgi:hypothetical protein
MPTWNPGTPNSRLGKIPEDFPKPPGLVDQVFGVPST